MNCYRNSSYPERLVDTFEAPDDHIFTLHDTLESSVAKYGDVRDSAFFPTGVNTFMKALFIDLQKRTVTYFIFINQCRDLTLVDDR